MKYEIKEIPSFEGLYTIDTNGNVYSLPKEWHTGEKHTATIRHNGRIIKQFKDKDGYYKVVLSKESKTKYIAVHRLLALTFISNEFNKPYVNHKNGVKDDNSINNLEWCTAKENTNHAIKTGLIKNIGSSNGRSKIVLDFNTGIFYETLKEAANAKNISMKNLSKKLTGYRNNNTSMSYV
jgi:hypothetical protein